MIYGNENVETYNGRFHLILSDIDGRDVTTHGIAVAPESCKTLDTAMFMIRSAYMEVSANAEWNYDDVHEKLKTMGFDIIYPGIWIE